MVQPSTGHERSWPPGITVSLGRGRRGSCGPKRRSTATVVAETAVTVVVAATAPPASSEAPAATAAAAGAAITAGSIHKPAAILPSRMRLPMHKLRAAVGRCSRRLARAGLRARRTGHAGRATGGRLLCRGVLAHRDMARTSPSAPAGHACCLRMLGGDTLPVAVLKPPERCNTGPWHTT